ncbi:hypothetical protein [Streptomyces sp. IB201691-2A2]|uniref:hypothetical protein n=1 Tax=Streptomyces sp. IB201691-2A2 TaxID=2561920 RepID=UPI00163DCAF4|nr:hypothetical protein [Streptomyces sp. IB201691-2A2]
MASLDALPGQPPEPGDWRGAHTLPENIRNQFLQDEPWYSPYTGTWHYLAEGYKLLSATAAAAGTVACWVAEHRKEFVQGAIAAIPAALKGIGIEAQPASTPSDTIGQKIYGIGVALGALAQINELAREAAKAYGIYRNPDQVQPDVNYWNVATNMVGLGGNLPYGWGATGWVRDPDSAKHLQGVGALTAAAGLVTTPFAKRMQKTYEPTLPLYNTEGRPSLPSQSQEQQGSRRGEPVPPPGQPPERARAALLHIPQELQRQVSESGSGSVPSNFHTGSSSPPGSYRKRR